jgi:hypothetical protein
MGLNKKTASTLDISPRKAVKILRYLYPIWAVVGIFGIQYVPSKLIVAGDAITTANNIVANELLFRMGIASSLITQLIHIVVVIILYKLFKSVNKNLALLVVIFGLVGVPIAMFNELNKFAVLLLSSGAGYLTTFQADQLQSLMMLFLNLNELGVIIAGIFWGLWLFPLGYLIYISDYFPKIVGVLVIIAGFGYVLDSFTRFVFPSAIFLPMINLLMYGEVVFMIWLIFKGAKLPGKESSN